MPSRKPYRRRRPRAADKRGRPKILKTQRYHELREELAQDARAGRDFEELWPEWAEDVVRCFDPVDCERARRLVHADKERYRAQFEAAKEQAA